MLCVSVMLVIVLADLASHGQVQLYASQGMHSTFNYFSLFTNAPALATVQVAPTPCVALMASPVSPLTSVPFSSICGRCLSAKDHLVAYILSAVLVANLATHGQMAVYANNLVTSTWSLFQLEIHAPATVQVIATPCVATPPSPVSTLGRPALRLSWHLGF